MLRLSVSCPLVGFIVISILVCFQQSQAAPIVGSVSALMKKLEAYALDKTSHTGLTIDELKNGLEEAQSWEQSVFTKKKETDPAFNLLVDFLFVPMLRYTDPTRDGVSQEFGSTTRRDYIVRLEKYYKTFRPAYFDHPIDNSYYKAPKTDQLLASLAGQRGSKPLTKKIVDDAIAEYDALMQRSAEIRAHDDIYSCANELKLIFNYKNRMEVQVLKESIFPLAPLTVTQENFDNLKSVYKSELRKQSVTIIDGQLFKLRSG